MTRLDRAFIKVYSKSSGSGSGPHVLLAGEGSAKSPVAASVAETPSEPKTYSSVQVQGDQPAGLAEPPLPAEHCRVDCQHVDQPPHWALAAESSGFTSFNIAAPPAEAVTARFHAEPDAGTVKPLSDVAASGARAAVPQPAEAAVLHAAFEVDNLLWPEINYSLAAACRPQWNQLVKEMMQASAAGQKIVLVTSHRRGEGRTSLVLCLAQLLSQKQQRVAIIDADYQRPQIARRLKLLPAAGWDDVLRQSQPVTEAWIESVRDGVTLVPISERPESKGLAGNSRLNQMLQALRQQNDLVLIDAGSLSDANDREMLALLGGTAQIDAAIMVRDVHTTTWDTLHDSQRCLDAIGIGRWDVVENFAD